MDKSQQRKAIIDDIDGVKGLTDNIKELAINYEFEQAYDLIGVLQARIDKLDSHLYMAYWQTKRNGRRW